MIMGRFGEKGVLAQLVRSERGFQVYVLFMDHGPDRKGLKGLGPIAVQPFKIGFGKRMDLGEQNLIAGQYITIIGKDDMVPYVHNGMVGGDVNLRHGSIGYRVYC